MNSTRERRTTKEIIYSLLSKAGIRIFQKVFPEYFAKQPLKPTDRYIEYSFVIQNLPKPPARVLDVGCSGSFFPLLLANFGYETYGVDIREYAIVNKIKFNNFQFFKRDIVKSIFPNNFFDAISIVSTIEHIGISGRHGVEEDDLEADKKVMEEMMRILKAKGVILLTIPFGKAKIVRPYHRIYDGKRLDDLVSNLKIEKEEYFMQDGNDDWYECSKEQAGAVDAKDKCPLCLLKITR